MEKQKADQIITKYLTKIYGFALKKSFSYDEAEEISSEIVCEVYSSLLKADNIANIEGYIWRISEHTYAKYVAYKKRHEGISLDGLQIPYYDEYFFENNDEELKRLSREVAYLGSSRRKIVFMFYYEGKSIQSISSELKIPTGTVKWHLNQARIELKEGLTMERKIGNLGLNPIEPLGLGHSGDPGNNKGPEDYIGDRVNLNIVYSVYHSPKTLNEIAQELGLTPVFIEDKINFLESNGFLVKERGGRYTTYVNFSPTKYSLELKERRYKLLQEIARALVEEYVPLVRKSIEGFTDFYVPSGNKEVFEAAVVFYAMCNNCMISANIDISKYYIKTTHGGEFIANVELSATQLDPEYLPTIEIKNYWGCGNMSRSSCKYPSVFCWSIDSDFSSRKGAWKNNNYRDYDYIYEILTGMISESPANIEKFNRLREREFLTDDGKINIIIAKDNWKSFFERLPKLDKKIKDRFAPKILEIASMMAKQYPPQMRDLAIHDNVEGFIGRTCALMALEILYSSKTFKPLTEQERVSANLIMFCDTLPNY